MAELWPGGPVELPHTITVDDVELTLPEMPTLRLLHLLAARAWWELLPNAVKPSESAPLFLRLFDDDDELDFEHLWEPAIIVLGRLAGTGLRTDGGTGWWPAVRLAGQAIADWPLFNAWCAGHGMDPSTAPLWRVIGAIYAWLRSLFPSQDLSKLDQEIWAPPPFVANAATVTQELPRHVRDEEAALALAALRETLPGEQVEAEWTPDGG